MKWTNPFGGNRRGRGKRLEVKARSGSRTRVNVGAWLRMIVIPVAFLAALGLAIVGVRYVGRLLFSQNDDFAIRSFIINTDDPVALGYLQGKRAIHKGVNLFSFNIGDVRADFLRHSPSYRAIIITRQLPDTIKIDVAQRQTLALINRRSGFAVDAEACVFGQRGAPEALPLILNYQGAFLKPGERIQGGGADAVRMLDVWMNADPDRELIVKTVDVRGGFRGLKNSLQVTLAGDGTVDLAWARGHGRAAEMEEIRGRILYLRGIVRRAADEGKRIKRADLTLDDYAHKSTVEYYN